VGAVRSAARAALRGSRPRGASRGESGGQLFERGIGFGAVAPLGPDAEGEPRVAAAGVVHELREHEPGVAEPRPRRRIGGSGGEGQAAEEAGAGSVGRGSQVDHVDRRQKGGCALTDSRETILAAGFDQGRTPARRDADTITVGPVERVGGDRIEYGQGVGRG
jgi:hypothetical protein